MAILSRDLGDLVQRGYRFALSLTHDANRAEDLLQDAWLGVLRARGPWKREYLFTTVRNRFVDQCRRDKRVGFQSLDAVDEIETRDESQLWDDEVSWVASNGAFDRALGTLRAEERAVLYLAALEGYSAREIGVLLDWPRGTVLSLMHRARGKIRQSVGAESGTES